MMIMKISMVMVMMIMGIIRMMRLKNGNYYENLSNDFYGTLWQYIDR